MKSVPPNAAVSGQKKCSSVSFGVN